MEFAQSQQQQRQQQQPPLLDAVVNERVLLKQIYLYTATALSVSKNGPKELVSPNFRHRAAHCISSAQTLLDALPSSSSESFTAAATNVAGFKSQLVLASAQLAAIDDNLIDSLNTTFQTIHDFTSSATTIIENVPIADRIAMALFCLDQATMTRSIAVNQSEAEAGTINYGDMMAIDENPFSLSFYSFVDLDIKWCLEGLGILESLTRTQPTASSSSSSSSTSATSPAIGTLELKTQFQIILASKYLEKHKSTTTKNGSRAEELQEEKGCDVDKQGEVTSIMPYLDRSLASIDTALVYAAACRRTTPSSSSSSSKTASKNINNNDGASSTSSLLLALKLKLDIMCCKLDCGGGSDGYSADAAIAPVVTTTTPDNALVDEFTRGVDVLCGGPSSNTATAAPASQIIGRDLDLVVGMVHLIAQRCKDPLRSIECIDLLLFRLAPPLQIPASPSTSLAVTEVIGKLVTVKLFLLASSASLDNFSISTSTTSAASSSYQVAVDLCSRLIDKYAGRISDTHLYACMMIAWKCANKALTADADNSKCAAWCTLAFRIVCLISQTPSSSLKEQNDGDGTVAGTESDDATRVNALVIVHKLAVCLIRCERLDEARRICLQGDLIDGSKSPTTAFLLACISLDQIKQTPPAVPRQRDDVLKKLWVLVDRIYNATKSPLSSSLGDYMVALAGKLMDGELSVRPSPLSITILRGLTDRALARFESPSSATTSMTPRQMIGLFSHLLHSMLSVIDRDDETNSTALKKDLCQYLEKAVEFVLTQCLSMDAMQDDDDDDNNPDSSEIGGPPSSASKRVTFASTAANTSSSSITPTHPMTSHITDLIDIAWTFIVDETRQMVDARLLGDDDDENDDGACNANGMVFPVANGVADRRLPPPRVLIDGIVTCWNAVLVLVSLCAEESLVTELLERKKICIFGLLTWRLDQLKSATLAKDVARLGEECRELIKQLKSTIVSLDIVHKPQTDAVAANSTTCATPADPYAATRIHTRLLKENEEIVQTCFSLEIEICIRLHDWDGITPVLEKASLARCPVKVFESISKLVLDASAITSLDPPCPLSVRFAALQRTLDAIVKHGGDGIGGDGLDLVRFSIWFRYLVETGLLANNEKKDSTRGLFKKALSIVTSAHNTDRPYPPQELLWLIATCWNYGLEQLYIDIPNEAKQWLEIAVRLCAFDSTNSAVTQQIRLKYPNVLIHL